MIDFALFARVRHVSVRDEACRVAAVSSSTVSLFCPDALRQLGTSTVSLWVASDRFDDVELEVDEQVSLSYEDDGSAWFPERIFAIRRGEILVLGGMLSGRNGPVGSDAEKRILRPFTVDRTDRRCEETRGSCGTATAIGLRFATPSGSVTAFAGQHRTGPFGRVWVASAIDFDSNDCCLDVGPGWSEFLVSER